MNDVLSKNFTKKELICPCCGLFLISPSSLSSLQGTRDILGCPILVNSASRCEAYNKFIGGSPNSRHMLGDAFDVRCIDPVYRFNLIGAAIVNGFTYFRMNGLFVHMDMRPGPYQIVII